MTYNKEIFIFDLDGTLLNAKRKIPSESLKFIKKIKAKGHELGFTTSRPYHSAEEILGDKIKLFDFIVTHNGCRVDYKGEVEYFKMPLGEIDQFFDPEHYVTAFSIDGILYADDRANLKEYAKMFRMNSYKHVDELTEDVLATRLIFKSLEEREAFWPELKRKFGSAKYDIEKSGMNTAMITPKETSRLEAIKKHFQDTHITYFADGEEDLAVFQERRLRITKVAPRNAIKEIKDLADIVLETNNDESLAIPLEE